MSDRWFEALLAAFAIAAIGVGFGRGALDSGSYVPGPREDGVVRVMT